MIKNLLEKNKYRKTSYSQGGEDILIDFIMSTLGIKTPSYIDIGAHHPFYLSNTAIFYAKGSRGICIEPDPILFKEIKKYRKKDVCLNVGIGFSAQSEADFYLMSAPTLNTFSKVEAIKYSENSSYKIKKVIKLPLININSIIQEYMKGSPDFISIDVEGLDYEIIKSFDFEKYRPLVFCVETLNYIKDGVEEKDYSIIDYLKTKNYLVYADTYMNTIFVDKTKWESRAK